MRKSLTWGPLLLAAALAAVQGQWATPRVTVVFPDLSTIAAEVADTPAARERGLMFRRELEPTTGMLFVFEQPGRYPFWMQNCLIPLDILWLDADGRILSIAEVAQPCALPSCRPPCGSNQCPTYGHDGEAKYAVEVMAGFARTHLLKIGDRVVLRGING